MQDSTEQLREISNIDDTMVWIESVFIKEPRKEIDEAFILELHRLTVKNVRSPTEGGEGDVKPGAFRSQSVLIKGASHTPPNPFDVPILMQELVAFMNEPQNSQFDLLRIAVAHHRFQYIHPFRNGNGRVGRLLTYAMLVRSGFRVHEGRIVNPSAIFCNDRDAYMAALSRADSGDDVGLLAWCEFVLSGLQHEIVKIDKLLDRSVLDEMVLHPALHIARQRGNISDHEWQVLSNIQKEQVADAALFKRFYPQRSAPGVSQVIARFKRHGLILPTPNENSRKYVVNYMGKDLLRPLVAMIDEAGFLPLKREP